MNGLHDTGSAVAPFLGPATYRSAFGAALIRGRLPWRAYADLLAQHFFLYESLEQAAHAMADDHIAGAFVVPEMQQLRALAADLRFLRGPGWANQLVACTATSTYCTRLREVAFHSSTGFVAHYITRHLDDLSSAPPLGRAAAAAYGLDGPGRLFLAEDGISAEDLRPYFGRLLETVTLRRADEVALITEADYARHLYAMVLDELSARWS